MIGLFDSGGRNDLNFTNARWVVGAKRRHQLGLELRQWSAVSGIYAGVARPRRPGGVRLCCKGTVQFLHSLDGDLTTSSVELGTMGGRGRSMPVMRRWLLSAMD
jgi:hypothetical protein